MSSVNDNFTPLQTVSYPPITITGTGTATYPRRDFKVSANSSDVYFVYRENAYSIISKSNNFGVLNCTNTTTLPSFANLALVDSLVAPITQTVFSFFVYSNITIPTYSSSVYSNTLSCISVGLNGLNKQAKEVFTLGQLGSSDYLVSSGITTLKTVKVFDITGNLIINMQDINSSKIKIDLSNYANGIYILKATSTENLEKVFKVLKL